MFRILKKVMMAHLLRTVAEDAVANFRLKFPAAHWSVWAHRAVDIVQEKTNADPKTCDRVVRAALFKHEKIKAEVTIGKEY